MPRFKRSRQTLPFYLLPVMIGLCGILFSRQFPNDLVRVLVVLMSVAVPLFTLGNAMARLRSGRSRRLVYVLGALMVLTGGAVALWDLSLDVGVGGVLVGWNDAPGWAWELSRWTGMTGLFLGIIVLLYMVVRREEEVDDLARRFSSLAEHMSEGFILTSPDGVITLVNSGFLNMTGAREEDLLGRSASELGQRVGLQPLLSEVRSNQQGGASEYTIKIERDGEERHLWVSGAPVFDSRGEFTGMLATFRDITDLQRLSARLERYTKGLQELVEDQTRKLRLSEQRMRGILLHMSEGFLTVDEDLRIRFANERFCSMLMIDPASLPGRGLVEFVDPVHRDQVLDLIRLAGEAHTDRLQRDVGLVRSDGVVIPVVLAVAPIDPEQGDTRQFSVVATHVGELVRMQRELEERAKELERANQELRELDRAKDSFLTNVSHELRTPLSTIQGYIEMLEDGGIGPLSEEQSGAIKVMRRNAERLGSLIEEMIDFGRMQVRGIDLAVSVIDAAELVREAVRSAAPQASAKGLKITSEPAQERIAAWGDRKRLGQVLGILMSNAVKFTPTGGSVTAGVDVREDGCLAIWVRDTGIGIDVEHQERVFDKFYQVDSALDRRYEGAGIGLSIARRIVEAHGGRILLESVPGEGSCFTVELPRAAIQTAAGDDHRGALAGRTALVVEADEALFSAVRDMLRASDCAVLHAQNVYEGIRMLRDQGADAALFLDGESDRTALENVRRLRSEGLMQPVVVCLSGTPDSAAMREIRALNARRLERPFTQQQLVVALLDAANADALDIVSKEDEVADERPSVVLFESDGDVREWIETGLARRGVDCRCVTQLDQFAEAVARDDVLAVVVDLDASVDNAGDWIAEVRRAMPKSTGALVAISGLPAMQRPRLDAARVLSKPFKLDELVRAIGVAPASRGGGPH